MYLCTRIGTYSVCRLLQSIYKQNKVKQIYPRAIVAFRAEGGQKKMGEANLH